MGAEPVVAGEGLPRAPLPARLLALDRTGVVGGEHDPVVLVGLVDHPGLVDLLEVAADAQVHGGQVGEPVRGGLVGDAERVLQVVHGQVPALLGGPQQRRRRPLRHEQRARQVVHRHTLGEEVLVVPRLAVAQDGGGEGLEHHRAAVVVRGAGAADVDAPVLEVRDGARGVRQVRDEAQGEAEVLGQLRDRVQAQRPARVADRVEQPMRLSLEVGVVVVHRAHPGAQLGVGAARLLGGGGLLLQATAQLGLQPRDHLEDLGGGAGPDAQRRQAEGGVVLRAREPFDLDLQFGPPGGGPAGEQVLDRHAQDLGDPLDQREPRLAAGVLHEGQVRAAHARALRELVQGEAGLLAQVPNAAAQRDGVHGRAVLGKRAGHHARNCRRNRGGDHVFRKESQILDKRGAVAVIQATWGRKDCHVLTQWQERPEFPLILCSRGPCPGPRWMSTAATDTSHRTPHRTGPILRRTS